MEDATAVLGTELDTFSLLATFYNAERVLSRFLGKEKPLRLLPNCGPCLGHH